MSNSPRKSPNDAELSEAVGESRDEDVQRVKAREPSPPFPFAVRSLSTRLVAKHVASPHSACGGLDSPWTEEPASPSRVPSVGLS